MYHHRYWFEAEVARQVLAALDRGDVRIEISVDLNLSLDVFDLQNGALVLDDSNRLGRDELQWIAGKKNRVFLLEGGELVVLESRDEGYYKLVPTAQAPLLEISGVKMHISKGINPFESAAQMAAQVVRKGDRVLDTCSGLGYAALAALRLGARQVVTVERSETVMALRRQNPWSQGLSEPGILPVQADVGAYIRELESASFDSIIHDPPRFSLAGELYGIDFYTEIHRVLKRRGGLFHYTGNPQLVRRGSTFVDQAVQRLKKAGFTRVEKVPALMGVRAWK
ncbi:MAG: RsmD family RNA methyltransferase [Desulfuromonadales bacterium]